MLAPSNDGNKQDLRESDLYKMVQMNNMQNYSYQHVLNILNRTKPEMHGTPVLILYTHVLDLQL